MAVVRLRVGPTTLDLAGRVVERRSTGELARSDGSRRRLGAPSTTTRIDLDGPPSEALLRLDGRHPEVAIDGTVLHDVLLRVRRERPWAVTVG